MEIYEQICLSRKTENIETSLTKTITWIPAIKSTDKYTFKNYNWEFEWRGGYRVITDDKDKEKSVLNFQRDLLPNKYLSFIK